MKYNCVPIAFEERRMNGMKKMYFTPSIACLAVESADIITASSTDNLMYWNMERAANPIDNPVE